MKYFLLLANLKICIYILHKWFYFNQNQRILFGYRHLDEINIPLKDTFWCFNKDIFDESATRIQTIEVEECTNAVFKGSTLQTESNALVKVDWLCFLLLVIDQILLSVLKIGDIYRCTLKTTKKRKWMIVSEFFSIVYVVGTYIIMYERT